MGYMCNRADVLVIVDKTSIGIFTISVVGIVHAQVLHSWVCVILQINVITV